MTELAPKGDVGSSLLPCAKATAIKSDAGRHQSVADDTPKVENERLNAGPCLS
jgi:hypothetical protein